MKNSSGNNQAAALLVLQAPRCLARRLHDERVRAGRAGLQQAELRRIDARVLRDLGQIATHQREMMVTIGVANAANALERVLVADVAAERVTGVGRIGDDAAATQNVHGLTNQPQMGIFRMEFEALHGEAGIIAACRP